MPATNISPACYLPQAAAPAGCGALSPDLVHAIVTEIVLPTYLPALPDKNPMFLEKRVYQGSSGKVYPLPFTDRISEAKIDFKWKAVWLENEFLRVLILPQIGGRIHAIQDKTNSYDAIYNQPVIKPALVGLAGPWISGGIEFNWPQHHRPATFLPVDVEVEEHSDGSRTVWCSDHDPMCRMKGMHGICLHPGKAYVELKVRIYNRTTLVQSFLWWANVGIRVHEGYQSFFPQDVYYVADHARRATSEYPLCKNGYYGVNYGERARKGVPCSERPAQFIPAHCQPEGIEVTQASQVPACPPNDLSWYANIPTPCSYMCMGSKQDFLGGYDYFKQAGLIHVANHHISPGKKQWTWGNHDFGYSWDRNLTNPDEHGEYGPYIELMAGVYTDNQPDFSFLQPGETKTWSQYWYPIQKIGVAQFANLDAAISLKIDEEKIQIGVSVSSVFPGATIRLEHKREALERKADLAPGKPFLLICDQRQKRWRKYDCKLRVIARCGREIISYHPQERAKAKAPPPASEPPGPKDVSSADELYVIGLHLDQYRHATRFPTLYWEEALRRDPGDARCNNAMGLWHLRRGDFGLAEPYFRQAIRRLIERNPNPYDGEPYYNLGLCLHYLERDDEAYEAFYKATWNQAWQSAGYHALAELDCKNQNWPIALDHLNHSLCYNSENTRARDLKAIVLRKLGLDTDAAGPLRETLAIDPLDWWARHLAGESIRCDAQTRLDIIHDFARSGLYSEAIELLTYVSRGVEAQSIADRESDASGYNAFLPDQNLGASPIVLYTLAWLHEKLRQPRAALKLYQSAAQERPDYCFPRRLEEIAVLEAAMQANPRDARAPYYLGNLFYDRRRCNEAIKLWERSAKLNPAYSVVWRNLGIGYFNISKRPDKSRSAYDRALRANPKDARVAYERDQLRKRMGEKPEKRLCELEKHPQLLATRDDLAVEICTLYNQTKQHDKALAILSKRKFQPWEGGEGLALAQHVRTHLALGRFALKENKVERARDHFEQALHPPQNLGEANHILANQNHIHYWLGLAQDRLGQKEIARKHWKFAAGFQGDFQEMSVREFSELTYYSALSWKRLGRRAKAQKLLRDLLRYARDLARKPAKVAYFATSLPTMLLFDDDLTYRQKTTALFLQAQAFLGLGNKTKANALLKTVLERDPNHPLAEDFTEEISEKPKGT